MGFITYVKENFVIITEEMKKELEVYYLYKSTMIVFEVRLVKLKMYIINYKATTKSLSERDILYLSNK